MTGKSDFMTNNFRLRKPDLQDLDKMFKMRSDPENNVFIERKEDTSKSDTYQFLKIIKEGIEEGKCFYWVVENIRDGDFLGTICLWNFKEEGKMADLGYELLTAHRGKGIIAEVMPCILQFAEKTLLLSSVQAEVHKDNIASRIHLLRNQFQLIETEGDYEIFELKFDQLLL
jgi:ribosomal-protein-alanine N-acetyltransferase